MFDHIDTVEALVIAWKNFLEALWADAQPNAYELKFQPAFAAYNARHAALVN